MTHLRITHTVDDEGRCVAVVIDVPGAVGYGATPEEAEKNAREALGGRVAGDDCQGDLDERADVLALIRRVDRALQRTPEGLKVCPVLGALAAAIEAGEHIGGRTKDPPPS